MISEALCAGSNFEAEELNVEPYKLLPLWWRQMEKGKKRKAYNIVESFDGKFTAACISKIKKEMFILFSEMQSFLVC